MKETFQDATEPCTGAVLETLDHICDVCGEMSLSALLKITLFADEGIGKIH
jgi:hypothetical protein